MPIATRRQKSPSGQCHRVPCSGYSAVHGDLPAGINSTGASSFYPVAESSEDYTAAAASGGRQYDNLDMSPRSCESAASFQCFNTHSPPILNLSPNLSPASEAHLSTVFDLREPTIARGKFTCRQLYRCSFKE